MISNSDYGLTATEVLTSRHRFGSNELQLHRASLLMVLLRQFNNPLLVILFATTALSFWFGDRVNASIILGIITMSVALGFINEFSSERTVEDLLKKVSLSALVLRAGIKQDIPISEVVVGDIVLLHHGAVVAADMTILDAKDLILDESALTGESMPVTKHLGHAEVKAYMGTVVSGGCGVGLVTAIAANTEFGHMSGNVVKAKEKTAFQKGLANLGTLMTRVIIVMALAICLLNIGLGRNPLQALLFSLAVAIGLTPALLPVIVTVSMARGAHRMAAKGVVVKELVAIEDLGNMDVLCTDKTGTLTEGKINLVKFRNTRDQDDRYILQVGLACNTAIVHHRIVGSPIDVAIWDYAHAHRITPLHTWRKVAEEEFDYECRCQFTVVQHEGGHLLLVKGAPESVLEHCKTYRDSTGQLVPLTLDAKRDLRAQFKHDNSQGLRLVAVAQRKIEKQAEYSFNDVRHLEMLGCIAFQDIPKPSAKHALDHLASLGVATKIVTGDNEIVTQAICHDIGVAITGILTGPAVTAMSEHELEKAVLEANIFARVSPDEKERIIKALKRAGKTVGYMGDGINDAAALHAADVSISVNTAVDIAKDVASIVLLRKGLDVIAEGVQEGRRIFTNTIKYILMGTSSNFGNMFSVAGASFFLPFLPMTPSQILLNNSLYDLSQFGLPSDGVDAEVLTQPRRWDIHLIYRYMLFFGPISSIFDYLSFAILWFGLHANEQHFQTGWFLESIATQILVVFVIRTSRPFYASKPGKALLLLCSAALLAAYALTISPLAHYVNMIALPMPYLLSLGALTVSYLIVVEYVKGRFLAQVRSKK